MIIPALSGGNNPAMKNLEPDKYDMEAKELDPET